MKNRFHFIVMLLLSPFCLLASQTCQIVIRTVHYSPQNEFYIMSQSTLIGEGYQKQTDTFTVKIEEPLPCFYIVNEDTSKVFTFWIEPGTIRLNIDADNVKKSGVEGSELNNDFFDFKRKKDSIFGLVNYNLKALSGQDDSLSAIYIKHEKALYRGWYKTSLLKTNSFHALDLIQYHLKQYFLKQEKASLSKKELWELFQKLDKKMKKYPTYKNCEALFRQKVPRNIYINEPLMK